MNDKNKVAKNYLYNFAYQILTFLTPVITAPYLARTLGSESMGINTYTYSIVYWFILLGQMGISVYGNKEIAKVSEDRVELSKKFSEIFCMQLINLSISITLFYIIFLIFNFKYKDAFLLQGLMIVACTFDISWLFNGLEDFKKITVRNFIVKILTVSLILLLIKNTTQYLLYIGISVAMSFFSNMVMWINFKKYISFTRPVFKNVIRHLKGTVILFLPQIATTIYSVFDQTMIGILYGDVSEVAFYSQAHKFVNMFLFVTTTIGVVMLPRIVKYKSKEGINKVKNATNKTLKMALFLSIPISFGIFSVAPYFIPWFLTEEFNKVGYLMRILSPIIIFISVTNVFGTQYMISTDNYKHYTLSVTLGCVFNLILNAITIPSFGAVGASISTLITEFFVLIYQFIVVRKEFDFTDIKQLSAKYLLLALAMTFVVTLIGKFMGTSIICNVIQISVGVFIYFGGLLITRDKMFKFFLDKGLSILGIKKD